MELFEKVLVTHAQRIDDNLRRFGGCFTGSSSSSSITVLNDRLRRNNSGCYRSNSFPWLLCGLNNISKRIACHHLLTYLLVDLKQRLIDWNLTQSLTTLNFSQDTVVDTEFPLLIDEIHHARIFPK